MDYFDDVTLAPHSFAVSILFERAEADIWKFCHLFAFYLLYDQFGKFVC